MTIASCLLATLAALQPPAAGAAAQPPLDWRTLEAGVLKDPVQITSRERFIKAGEAYFSPDDRWVVFQAVETPVAGQEADPFYAMYVAPVRRDETGQRIIGLGEPVRVSEPGTANTCGWFDPVRTGMVIFGSTITRPADEQKSGFQVGTRRYVWMFPAEMEVVEKAFLPMLDISTSDGGTASTAAQAMASLRMELERLKAAAAPTPAGAATGLAQPAGMKRAITAEMVELELNVRHITSETIRIWQDQTQLMMDVPGLRVHDAQLLVGASITTREDLANASARTIFELAMEFLATPEGERVLRDDQVLHEDEVEEWIEMAQDAA